MDVLTYYIQKGKKLTVLKLFFVFLLLVILVVSGVGVRLNSMLSEPDFHTFLTEIPVIKIQDGVVVEPENKVWVKKLMDNQFLLQIDTTKDKADNFSENGVVLTRKNVLFSLNDQVKEYHLPQEKTIIDTSFLLRFFQMIILNTCVLIGFILLMIFLLGQASTSVLSSFCLWILNKKADKDQIRRASFIGWVSIVFLNIFLRVSGHGFSLITCVLIATVISVFGLLWMDRNVVSGT